MEKRNSHLKTALLHTEIEDKSKDKEKLEPEEAVLNLPDVKDILGQQYIHPPHLKEFADTTISSDDEEGKGIIGLDEELDAEENIADDETNVSAEEKELLQRSSESMATEDDEDRRKLMLDKTDNEGDVLNENDNISGRDLDIPGAEDDDDMEDIGEEDEENNDYSLGGDRKD